jgi:hypothetical protein
MMLEESQQTTFTPWRREKWELWVLVSWMIPSEAPFECMISH